MIAAQPCVSPGHNVLTVWSADHIGPILNPHGSADRHSPGWLPKGGSVRAGMLPANIEIVPPDDHESCRSVIGECPVEGRGRPQRDAVHEPLRIAVHIQSLAVDSTGGKTLVTPHHESTPLGI